MGRKLKVLLAAQSCCWLLFATPWTIACQALCPWNSPSKNIGVDCRSLFQELFPTQGSNPGLPHCKQFLHCLRHNSPQKVELFYISRRILKWFTNFGNHFNSF